MAEIIYPSSKALNGPWLITTEDLHSLQESLDKIWELQQNFCDHTIRLQVEKDLPTADEGDKQERRQELLQSYPYSQKQKLVQIYFRGRKKISAETITEIIKDQRADDLHPYGFSIELRFAEVSFEIELNRRAGNQELLYSIRTENQDLANNIIYEIEKWIRSVRQAPVVRMWSYISNLHWGAVAAYLGVVLVLSLSWSVKRTQYEKDLNNEIQAFIENGSTETDLPAAIELLLKKNSRYVPEDYEPVRSPQLLRLLKITIVVLFISLLLSFPPKTNLGFGKGESRIKFWKFWIKLIFITIPSSIILPLILSQIRLF